MVLCACIPQFCFVLFFQFLCGVFAFHNKHLFFLREFDNVFLQSIAFSGYSFNLRSKKEQKNISEFLSGILNLMHSSSRVKLQNTSEENQFAFS